MSDLNQIRDHFVNLNISQLESIGDRLSNDSSIQALISSEPEIRVSTLSNVIITSLSLILNLIITVIIIIISWRSRTRRSESNGRVLNSLSVLTSEPSTASSHHYSSLLSSQSLLTIHSILNVFSVSDLFGQLFSRNFDSHNYSIQQFNLSLAFDQQAFVDQWQVTAGLKPGHQSDCFGLCYPDSDRSDPTDP
ncbi:expressed protein [Phakopsora pachyrhizi]|uniref:Expressed protein n=1 Tax=Phakopsora pachyrhizi TaxID=170000 RepID=A0AAV0AI29_PHAPC|nr:expressed protein [Phakopsora pachyrhizi]